MKYIITFVAIVSLNALQAQNAGSIEFRTINKIDIQVDKSLGIDLSGMLPESTTSYNLLHFDKDQSAYVSSDNTEEEDTVMESDDGSFKMEIQMSTDKSVTHTDLKNKIITEQKDFMGKTFLITDKRTPINWKISNEKIKYLDYECQKATAQGEIDENGESKEVIAWFTTQLPVSIGPAGYNGLPGAILMVSINGEETQIQATEINLSPPAPELLKAPTKGKKVDNEEYLRIVEERTKEMMENSGSGTFIIRG